jgi:hypothetical protein
MMIEVSNGELLDKFSILTIKLANIRDYDKIKNVEKEIKIIEPMFDSISKDLKIKDLFEMLLEVNKKLWIIEDNIREHERNKNFGESFIELARNVYITNDIRATLKKEINFLSNSNIIEEKSYERY